MPEFNEALNSVLRYSMDTVENLVSQLATPEHNQNRWGGPEADHTFRGVVADALRDNDRHTEADLLNDPKQHVVVDGGRVRAGRFTTDHIQNEAEHAAAWLDPYTDWHIWENAGIDHSGDEYSHNDLYGKVRALKNGEVRVVYHTQYPHNYENVHQSQLGNHFADWIHRIADMGVDWNEVPDADEAEYGLPEFDRRMQALRTAPYEEVDPTHPSERQ